MKKYCVNVLMALITLAPFISHAQTNKDSAISIFKTLCTKYSNTDYLSFRLGYSYRDEAKPAVILDSLFGNVMMNKENYHILLGNTETIYNNSYNIILFKEDTLMYISKPSVAIKRANPISIIDSMLLKKGNVDISLKDERGITIIILKFPEGTNYRSAEFHINKKTGYLTKVKYEVKAILMLDPADRTAAANNSLQNDWGIVESYYYQYKTGQFGDSEFDEKKYFTKIGTEFKPTDTYKQYKIFIASPGL